MIEKQKEIYQPRNEAEIRLKKLELATVALRNKLNTEEVQMIKAIIVYGSTARGMVMYPDADIDLHIDMEPYDDNVFKKITDIMKEQLSGIDLSFTSKNIIEGGRMARLITSQKYPDKPAEWKFLYSRSEEEKLELDKILSEKQKIFNYIR